jgi:hypothetical protein
MQVAGKLSKKSIARKETELLAALAIECGPPGSPERLRLLSATRNPHGSPPRHSEAFKESPYIVKNKAK